MSPTFQRAFSHLHRRNLETFGDPENHLSWWTPERKEDGEETGPTEYTRQVPCACAPLRASQAQMAGAVGLETDSLTFHASVADLPWLPQPGDVFLLGPATAEGRPADTCQPYLVQPFSSAPYLPHIRFTAQKHGTPYSEQN